MALRMALAAQRGQSRFLLASVRPAAASVRCASSSSSTQGTFEGPAKSKEPDYLLKFDKFSSQRDAYHYTSYVLALGIPAALLIGPPISTVVDLAAGVIIPLHFHMGVRSVLVDYVHEIPTQRMAIGGLAVVTVLTILGLTTFNVKDVGLTAAIKNLYIRQPTPASLETAESSSSAAASKKHH